VNLSFKNRFPYISVIDEASDFKFGTQLGFAKAHHKITPRGKSGVGLDLWELPGILVFPIIFLQRLGLGTSNLVHNLGFPNPNIKPHPEEKWAWPWAREAPRYLGFSFSISATAALSS